MTAEPDWPAANKRKAGIVNQLHKGLSGLLKRRKVTVIAGTGRLTADGAVDVDGQRVQRQGDHPVHRFGAAGDPRHGPGRRAGGQLRPRHEQHRGPAAGARGGHRRRGDRRRVRLRVHRSRRRRRRCWRRSRTACCRSGPTGTWPTCSPSRSPGAAPRSTPRPGSAPSSGPRTACWSRTRRPKGADKIEVDQVLVVHRPAPGERGRRRRGGRRPRRSARVLRGRHARRC